MFHQQKQFVPGITSSLLAHGDYSSVSIHATQVHEVEVSEIIATFRAMQYETDGNPIELTLTLPASAFVETERTDRGVSLKIVYLN